jgi:MGT family glycosyltransferase
MPAKHPFDDVPPARGVIGNWRPKRIALAPEAAFINLWDSAWATNLHQAISKEKPDVVVIDFFLPGAMAAAEASRVPFVVLSHNVPVPTPAGQPPRYYGFLPPKSVLARMYQAYWGWARDRIYQRNGLSYLNNARASQGLEPVRHSTQQMDSAARLLMLAPREFDLPAPRLRKNVRYVGSPIDDRASIEWHSPWPEGDTRPLVLITLSTLSVGQAPIMQRLLDAVGTVEARVLVTLGPALADQDFKVPSNCVIEAFVPHSAVLPHTSAIVSQCGMSTLAKALTNGVPVVCVPLTGDQPDNAVRVVYLGAGVRVAPDAPIEVIRDAIRSVLADSAYRIAAQRIGTTMSRQIAEEVAADEIEEVAAGT